MVKLVDGVPKVNGLSDLSGKRIVDVKGKSPTDDGLQFVTNSCTGVRFKDYTVVVPVDSGNDAAMEMLMKE